MSLLQEDPESSYRSQVTSSRAGTVPLLLQMSLITIRYRYELAHIGPGLAAVPACWDEKSGAPQL
jgi:hypothetical protein